jgi:hypothetical protein
VRIERRPYRNVNKKLDEERESPNYLYYFTADGTL